jgi:hypothetical protein
MEINYENLYYREKLLDKYLDNAVKYSLWIALMEHKDNKRFRKEHPDRIGLGLKYIRTFHKDMFKEHSDDMLREMIKYKEMDVLMKNNSKPYRSATFKGFSDKKELMENLNIDNDGIPRDLDIGFNDHLDFSDLLD